MGKIKNLIKPRLKLVKGTRFTSFLFIAISVLIAAGILLAANMYYNIDTGEVVTEEIQRVTGILRATAGAIVGGTATQNPTPGFGFEVVTSTRLATTTVAAGPLELTAANQLLKFTGGISGYYVGFQANTSSIPDQAITYTFPAAKPTSENYVLTSDSTGKWEWKSVSGVGAGDIQAVGDCPSGECFTTSAAASTTSNNLWFSAGTGAGTIKLTAADVGANNYTITLPASNGYVVLGSSTAGYVAYWDTTNVLKGEAQLSVSRGGTGKGSWTQYGVLYADGATSLSNTGAGTQNYVLSGNGSAAPGWKGINSLVYAENGLTASATGTNQLTIKLGGNLTGDTTITQGNYNLIYNLTGTGDFIVQDNGTAVFTVKDDGTILYKTYALAETGKEVLREMVPIMGFDLPVRTATSANVVISRTIQTYPFSACATGTTRVHKLVIRYGSMGETSWAVATSTGSYTSFTVPTTNSTSSGTVYTSVTDIPTPAGNCSTWSQTSNTDDWWIKLSPAGNDTMVYQVFLAAYDRLQ